MDVLTLKIPESLNAALLAASHARGMSKSAVVREALEQSLGRQSQQAGAAERWLSEWRGRLAESPSARKSGLKTKETDDRMTHLLAKHLR